MKTLAVLLFAALTLRSDSQAPKAPPNVFVNVYDSSGAWRAGFQVDVKPYEPSDRFRVSVAFVKNHNVRDAKGIVITGMAFYAWQDGAVIRMQVFAQVPAPGMPNRYLAEPGDDSKTMLVQRPFSTFIMKMGEMRDVDGMAALGVKPMKVSLGPMPKGR